TLLFASVSFGMVSTCFGIHRVWCFDATTAAGVTSFLAIIGHLISCLLYYLLCTMAHLCPIDMALQVIFIFVLMVMEIVISIFVLIGCCILQPQLVIFSIFLQIFHLILTFALGACNIVRLRDRDIW
ncbi:hypothetical protein PMAYCL1PPCAC_08457, partial [Pristionchus mayeri]